MSYSHVQIIVVVVCSIVKARHLATIVQVHLRGGWSRVRCIAVCPPFKQIVLHGASKQHAACLFARFGCLHDLNHWRGGRALQCCAGSVPSSALNSILARKIFRNRGGKKEGGKKKTYCFDVCVQACTRARDQQVHTTAHHLSTHGRMLQ